MTKDNEIAYLLTRLKNKESYIRALEKVVEAARNYWRAGGMKHEDLLFAALAELDAKRKEKE